MQLTPLHEGEFAVRNDAGTVSTIEFVDGTYITRSPSGEYRACSETGDVLYSGTLDGAWNTLEFGRAVLLALEPADAMLGPGGEITTATP